MSLNRSLLKIWLISVICFALLVMGIDSGSAVPCEPCDTWGSIRDCFSPQPPACCDCTKFEQQYYYYQYYLGADPSISPNDLRAGGKYYAAYSTWIQLRLTTQAPVGSTTWGAIKSLF